MNCVERVTINSQKSALSLFSLIISIIHVAYRQSPACHRRFCLHPWSAHQSLPLRWTRQCCGWSGRTLLCRCSHRRSCVKHELVMGNKQLGYSKNKIMLRVMETYLSNTRKHSANSSSLLPAWSSFSSLTIMTKNSSKSMVPLPEKKQNWFITMASPTKGPLSCAARTFTHNLNHETQWQETFKWIHPHL